MPIQQVIFSRLSCSKCNAHTYVPADINVGMYPNRAVPRPEDYPPGWKRVIVDQSYTTSSPVFGIYRRKEVEDHCPACSKPQES